MQVAVERRPGSQVVLTVTVEPEQVKERAEQLFQKYARRVSIPGFRPGKAPRALVEGRIDQQALMQDAIDGVIDATYKAALRDLPKILRSRAKVQARRRVSSFQVARAMTWNPQDLRGRRPVIRPLRPNRPGEP